MFGLSYEKLIGGLAAALFLLGLIAERARWMHRAHDAEAQVTAACDATRKAANRPKLDCKQIPQQIQFLGDALNDVRAKTAAAQAADTANKITVESRQNAISQESSNDYQAAIAAARARAGRVRPHSSAGTNQGRGGNPAVPGASASANGPDAAAAQAGLPPDDALIATEQAIQLKALQDWARKEGLAK